VAVAHLVLVRRNARTMNIRVLVLLVLALVPSSHASELERFWVNFPGFKNTLASYGYDRSFSRLARPEFVDAVVHDVTARPSKQRLSEYMCVLFYMDRKIVSDRLSLLDSSASPDTRRASATVRSHLEEYARDSTHHKK
jgi:hypothetical protein